MENLLFGAQKEANASADSVSNARYCRWIPDRNQKQMCYYSQRDKDVSPDTTGLSYASDDDNFSPKSCRDLSERTLIVLIYGHLNTMQQLHARPVEIIKSGIPWKAIFFGIILRLYFIFQNDSNGD